MYDIYDIYVYMIICMCIYSKKDSYPEYLSNFHRSVKNHTYLLFRVDKKLLYKNQIVTLLCLLILPCTYLFLNQLVTLLGFCLLFCLSGTGAWLRAMHFPGKCSITWTKPLVLLLLVYFFRWGSHSFAQAVLTMISCFHLLSN
jgi:hypothetical protein